MVFDAGLNVSEIINRLKDALGLTTDASLAVHLGVSSKTVASWRSRNSLPIESILQVSTETEKPIEYFLYGIELTRNTEEIDIEDVTLKDFQIVGYIVLVDLLREFAKDDLEQMNDEELLRISKSVGLLMRACFEYVKSERGVLVDTGTLSESLFAEYVRKALRVDLPYHARALENVKRRGKKVPQ